MRQGQQNRRGRGRGRKAQNPLSRNYESNGPEVKIRGNASHIAEKYSALARDALASGDTVTAENYLQHAEHYYRIIMAAQAQSSGGQQASEGANGANPNRAQSEGSPDENDKAATPSAEGADGADGQAGAPTKKKAKANGKSKATSASEDDDANASESDGAPSDNATA